MKYWFEFSFLLLIWGVWLFFATGWNDGFIKEDEIYSVEASNVNTICFHLRSQSSLKIFWNDGVETYSIPMKEECDDGLKSIFEGNDVRFTYYKNYLLGIYVDNEAFISTEEGIKERWDDHVGFYITLTLVVLILTIMIVLRIRLHPDYKVGD